MLTGIEYKRSLRDGRKVWIFGDGDVPDLTTHEATAGLVDEYALWYERHLDPAWADELLAESPDGNRKAVGLAVPQSSSDLVKLTGAIYSQAFVGAGNVTHTPTYGALIALGILDAVELIGEGNGGRPDFARAYRDRLEQEGFFLTLTGGAAVLGDRFRPPAEHSAMRIVKETDAGLVVSGRTGMHTSTPFAHDVYIGLLQRPEPNQRAMFSVAVNSPGARVIARRPAARYHTQFMSPLSSRYDELDAHLWLDNVLVPWEKVFAYNVEQVQQEDSKERDRIYCWLVWHHQISYLARADFTLGLALATAEAMGQKENPAVLSRLIDLMINAQTMRTCVTAANLDPKVSGAGHLYPNPLHVASATLYTLSVRQRMAEILRDLPGSSLVITPSDTDFEDPEMKEYLDKSFGGGAFTAEQRAALLNLVWDHVASGLDGRESAFEMHASGGQALWRNRMQRWFDRGNELANGVLQALNIDMPPIDVEGLRIPAFPGFGPQPSGNGAAAATQNTANSASGAPPRQGV